jgi:hypothetical protein
MFKTAKAGISPVLFTTKTRERCYMKKLFFSMALTVIATFVLAAPISAQGRDDQPVQRGPIHAVPHRPPTRVVHRPGPSTLSVIERYDSWALSDGTAVNDVISLDPANFKNQMFANAHTVYTASGDVLLVGYGDDSLGDTTRCDSTFVVDWKSDGTFALPTDPALTYGPGPVMCGITGSNGGGLVGRYLGTGVGTAQAGGTYYGILPVGKPETGESWMAWAVSSDGFNWKFAGDNGPTDDPEKAAKLIRREDMTKGLFGHAAMVYHDGWFYMSICVWTDYGIIATWWRFDGRSSLQILDGPNGFIPSNGVMPYDLTPSISPANASDPFDLVMVGDSLLFVYEPNTGFGALPPTFQYAFGSLPGDTGIAWQPSKQLDLGDFWTTYTGCGAGSGFNLAWRNGEWFAFVAARRRDTTTLPPVDPVSSADCGPYLSSQGLVRVKLDIK